MTDGAGPDGGPTYEAGAPHEARSPGPDTHDDLDVRQLAQDWITLWQSELAAIAVDREAQESWQVLFSLWAGAASAVLHAMPRAARRQPSGRSAQDERPTGRPRPEPAARSASAAAPSDTRDAEIERLARHVADLEARLAGLERGNRRRPPGQPGRRKP